MLVECDVHGGADAERVVVSVDCASEGAPVKGELVSVSCPAPGCDMGDDDRPLVIRAESMQAAMRERKKHLRHAHPGYSPPSGSMMDKVPRLD